MTPDQLPWHLRSLSNLNFTDNLYKQALCAEQDASRENLMILAGGKGSWRDAAVSRNFV